MQKDQGRCVGPAADAGMVRLFNDYTALVGVTDCCDFPPEAQRIERKYSRYRDDSVVHHVNHAGGWPKRLIERDQDWIETQDEVPVVAGAAELVPVPTP